MTTLVALPAPGGEKCSSEWRPPVLSQRCRAGPAIPQSGRRDPTVLMATIEQARSLGDTENAITRLSTDIKRLTTEANRELSTLGLWSGDRNM